MRMKPSFRSFFSNLFSIIPPSVPLISHTSRSRKSPVSRWGAVVRWPTAVISFRFRILASVSLAPTPAFGCCATCQCACCAVPPLAVVISLHFRSTSRSFPCFQSFFFLPKCGANVGPVDMGHTSCNVCSGKSHRSPVSPGKWALDFHFGREEAVHIRQSENRGIVF